MGRHAAKAGTHVVIPYRDEDEKRHLRVTGDLGQITALVRVYLSCCWTHKRVVWRNIELTRALECTRNGTCAGPIRLKSV